MFAFLKNIMDKIADSTFCLQLNDADIVVVPDKGCLISEQNFGKQWQHVIRNSHSVEYCGKYGRVKFK